jgi:ADP-ribose pyrophosphatase YjhB (NUDIX family)
VTEERRFARFRPSAGADPMVFPVPTDGMCISTFLVLRPQGKPGHALVGRLDPTASWGAIGGLDPPRARRFASGWMLPSSQLLYYESAEASARRIGREQLGLELGPLPAPVLMSDTSVREPTSPTDRHWDLGFVYVVDGQPPAPPRHPAWTELQYVEVARTPRREFARSHDEVLALAGLTAAD